MYCKVRQEVITKCDRHYKAQQGVTTESNVTRNLKHMDNIIDEIPMRQVFQTVTRSCYKVRRKQDVITDQVQVLKSRKWQIIFYLCSFLLIKSLLIRVNFSFII